MMLIAYPAVGNRQASLLDQVGWHRALADDDEYWPYSSTSNSSGADV